MTEIGKTGDFELAAPAKILWALMNGHLGLVRYLQWELECDPRPKLGVEVRDIRGRDTSESEPQAAPSVQHLDAGVRGLLRPGETRRGRYCTDEALRSHLASINHACKWLSTLLMLLVRMS